VGSEAVSLAQGGPQVRVRSPGHRRAREQAQAETVAETLCREAAGSGRSAHSSEVAHDLSCRANSGGNSRGGRRIHAAMGARARSAAGDALSACGEPQCSIAHLLQAPTPLIWLCEWPKFVVCQLCYNNHRISALLLRGH
jgi:hypothetical protein